jgi:hypothetical protein
MSGPTTPARRRVWAGPRSLAATWGVAIAFLSSGYLDVSVHRVRSVGLCIQPTVGRNGCPSDSGCPIRVSGDQRLVGSSSRLIAASYALHRLPTPRHPPCALSNLTTFILVSRASPGLPAVRHAKQEPSAFLVSAWAPRAPVAESDGPWSRLSRFSSCIRRCGYNYPLCRYSLFKDPTSLPIAGGRPLKLQRSTARGQPPCQGEVRRSAADEQERVEQETAGERGAGPAAPRGHRSSLPYSPALLSPAHLLYAAGGGVVEPKGFEPMTSWLQTRRSPG